MVKCPTAVWGEHIYILFLLLGWGRVSVVLYIYSQMLRSPCVCGRRTSIQGYLSSTAKCILPYRVIKACVTISIFLRCSARSPEPSPTARNRKKCISLCESYDCIIEILKVIGHPRIGQMTWDSIRYVVARNSRLWFCYMS